MFVFASNSGHVRIDDFLLFLALLFSLNYFWFNLFLFLQKSGGLKLPQPLPLRGPCDIYECVRFSLHGSSNKKLAINWPALS